MSISGKLIVLEGPIGVGKTSVSNALENRLSPMVDAPVLTRSFPGDQQGSIGHLIYDLHHNRDKYITREIDPLALQLFHVASHVDNLKSDLLPRLQNGEIIILHRCWWSTRVFGRLTGCELELLERFVDIEREMFNLIDYTVFLLDRPGAVNEAERIEYSAVAESESAWHPFFRINNHSIDNAVSEIIKEVCCNR